MSNVKRGVGKYFFVEQYDDGSNFKYYLFANVLGRGYIMRESKASRSTLKYSLVYDKISQNLWNFTTHQPRLTNESDYYYLFENPDFKEV